jgi:hypothetical protein
MKKIILTKKNILTTLIGLCIFINFNGFAQSTSVFYYAFQNKRSITEVNGKALPNELNDISFKAFPNPFSDQLTIFYQLPVNSNSGSLSIFEMGSGKLIFSTPLISSQNKLSLENLNFTAGVYLCRILSNDGATKVFKLVNIK